MSNIAYTAVKIHNKSVQMPDQNLLITAEKYFGTREEVLRAIQGDEKFRAGDHFLFQKVVGLSRIATETKYQRGDEDHFETLGILRLGKDGKIEEALFHFDR